MPYRTFADDQGKSWKVLEVRPSSEERRAANRRASQEARLADTERRAEVDRRATLDSRLDYLHPLAHGWLLFKCHGQKRRLAPIPIDWDLYESGQLRELWKSADVIVTCFTGKSP